MANKEKRKVGCGCLSVFAILLAIIVVSAGRRTETNTHVLPRQTPLSDPVQMQRNADRATTPAVKPPVPPRKHIASVTVEGVKSRLSQRFKKEVTTFGQAEASKNGLDVFSCTFEERFSDDSSRKIFLTGDGDNLIRGIEILIFTFPGSKLDPRVLMVEPLKAVLSNLSPSDLTAEKEKWIWKSVREGEREAVLDEDDVTFRVFNNKQTSTVSIYTR